MGLQECSISEEIFHPEQRHPAYLGLGVFFAFKSFSFLCLQVLPFQDNLNALLLATSYFKDQSCLLQAARKPVLVLCSLQAEYLLTFHMHDSPSRRITCRKVGKEQTNPNHSPSDLCLISLQSTSIRALGKGATALVCVLLSGIQKPQKNFANEYYTGIAIFSQQELPRTKPTSTSRISGPHPTPKKDLGFAD